MLHKEKLAKTVSSMQSWKLPFFFFFAHSYVKFCTANIFFKIKKCHNFEVNKRKCNVCITIFTQQFQELSQHSTEQQSTFGSGQRASIVNLVLALVLWAAKTNTIIQSKGNTDQNRVVQMFSPVQFNSTLKNLSLLAKFP